MHWKALQSRVWILNLLGDCMKIDYSYIKKMVEEDQINAKVLFDKRYAREIDALVEEIAGAAKRQILDAVETFYRTGEHPCIKSKGVIVKRYFYRGNLRSVPNTLKVFSDLQKGDYTIKYFPHTESEVELRFRTVEQVNIFLSKTNALLKGNQIEISWNWLDGRLFVRGELGKL